MSRLCPRQLQQRRRVMKLRQALAMLCVAGVWVTPVLAQVKLQRKVNEGSTQTIEASTRLEQKLSIAGMDTETESTTKTTVKSTVGKRDDAGQIRVQQKIESLQISAKVMGTEYVFEST